LGVNFFRFPFSLGGGEGDNSKNPKAEQSRQLKEILEEVKSVVRVLSSYTDPDSYLDPSYIYRLYKYRDANLKSSRKNILLDDIERYYNELKDYEEKDEQARETREKLFKILEENGHYPEEDKKEDKEK